LTPGSRIRNPGGVKNQDQDPESGMNIPDHISESFETMFRLKYLISFMRIRIRNLFDPGSGMEIFQFWMNIPDIIQKTF
jgi:hypothetical protein